MAEYYNWIPDKPEGAYSTYKCSKCGKKIYVHSIWETESFLSSNKPMMPEMCLKCGAKMEVTSDSNRAVL